MTSSARGRALFLIACVVAAVAIGAYVAATRQPAVDRRSATPASTVAALESVPDGPSILFTDESPSASFGHVALASLPISGEPRRVASISCERVHFAAGHGVCMVSDQTRMPVRYQAFVFDRAFRRGQVIELTGPPIRARVAPDGRRAALTVFERGHSYADNNFSTRTIVIDAITGDRIGDLEEFVVEKDGRPFRSVDFNFWGVTFDRGSDRFFATLKTRGERYLVEGSVDARRVRVVRADVECPSVSPDGALIVFKKPIPGGVGWRLHVLDLATLADRPLNQIRLSVDDQVDWFDERQVVYHDSAAEGTGIWVLPVDGVSPPRLILPNAYSPAVQR